MLIKADLYAIEVFNRDEITALLGAVFEKLTYFLSDDDCISAKSIYDTFRDILNIRLYDQLSVTVESLLE